jgi:hypothetical protein
MEHSEPLSSADICWLLRAKFKRPEFAIVFEIGDSTGLRVKRHADVVVMNCFPSRGLTLHGIEIKISREDLKREIREPEKAEPVAAYCDTWSIAVPKSLNITGLEVPTNWGIYEAEPDKITLIRNPTRLEPKPVDRNFLAALLRADGIERDFISSKLVAEKTAELEASFNKRVDTALSAKVTELDERSRWFKRLVTDLEFAGIKWTHIRWREREFVEAIKYALSSKGRLSGSLIQKAIESLERCAKELKAHVNSEQVEVSGE